MFSLSNVWILVFWILESARKKNTLIIVSDWIKTSKHQGCMNPAGKSVKTGLFEETWEKFTAQPCDYDITVAIKTVWRIKNLRVSWKTNYCVG